MCTVGTPATRQWLDARDWARPWRGRAQGVMEGPPAPPPAFRGSDSAPPQTPANKASPSGPLHKSQCKPGDPGFQGEPSLMSSTQCAPLHHPPHPPPWVIDDVYDIIQVGVLNGPRPFQGVGPTTWFMFNHTSQLMNATITRSQKAIRSNPAPYKRAV